MPRVKKVCKWCGHSITFDKDKYIQQGRADVIDELMKIVADGEKRKYLWCEVISLAEQLKEQRK